MKKIYNLINSENIYKRYAKSNLKLSPFNIGIPLIDMSNKTIEQIYYFRWNVYCKHIKLTQDGYVITEFLPDVPWSGKYNTICCPAGHHFYEGRWLHDQSYTTDYARFWFTKAAEPRLYSFWAADSILAMCMVSGKTELLKELFEPLKNNYFEWEKSHLKQNGLFYQADNRDGMEFSISGSGYRPTINSYMCGDAYAIYQIAELLGKKDDADIFYNKYQKLKKLINTKLWNNKADFYMTRSEKKDYNFSGVREEIGYIPWYFNIPDNDKASAWKFLNNENYFEAPFGPTTAEKNHPEFMKEYPHECLWNGPSWPFATSQTLTSLGNLLNNYNQNIMKKRDYFQLLNTYSKSQFLDGEPFIDENIDPFTGRWLARECLKSMNPPRPDADRGKDYNHSSFCDLVLSGLAGIRPSLDSQITVNPLFEEDDLDYFCADGIQYHGQYITVVWDRYGKRYNIGKGLSVLLNGERIITNNKLEAVNFNI